MLGRDNFFDLADDEIPGNELGWLGKDVVAESDWRKVGDVSDFRDVVLVFVLAFLAGGGVNGENLRAVAI